MEVIFIGKRESWWRRAASLREMAGSGYFSGLLDYLSVG